MRRTALVLLLACGLLAAAAPAAAAVDRPYRIAILQGLDKITARVSTFEAPVGEMVRFGTLEIVVRACFESPPVEPPESAAFLEIDAVDPGRERKRAFSGWMFASSPSISALEHPVYDVWVLDCIEPLEAAEEGAEDALAPEHGGKAAKAKE